MDAHVAVTTKEALQVGERHAPTADHPFSPDAVVPCKEEEDRAAARTALDALDHEIRNLDEAATPGALHRAQDHLHALLATACFELASADLEGDKLEFDSGYALRDWWSESESAFRRRVDDEEPGSESESYVTLPGEPRRSLLLANNEAHPLAPLLCPTSDRACGSETVPWIERAGHVFRSTSTSSMDCAQESLRADPDDRWATLVDCQRQNAGKETMFPLGRFRAMTDGYLVITSPPSNCGSIEVYDLASGATIRSASCAHGNGPAVVIGRAPLAMLREAAWVLAIGTFAQDDVRRSTSFVIPEHVAVGREPESFGRGSLHLHGGWSHDPTAWTWYRPKNGQKGAPLVAQVTGLTSTGRSTRATSYAQDLLRYTNMAIVNGCSPAFSSTSLASIPWNDPGPAVDESSKIGFDFQAPQLRAARDAVSKAKTPKICTTPL